jgi:hypothetical protein
MSHIRIYNSEDYKHTILYHDFISHESSCMNHHI